MKNALLALSLWATLGAAAFAQTLVDLPEGYKAQIPAGYNVRQDLSGAVAGNTDGTAAIVLKAHNYRSFEAFAGEANLQRDGFTLVGEPRVVGSDTVHFRASKPGPKGLLIADTFVTFTPNGGGCLIVALSDQAHSDSAYYSAYDVVTSVQVTEPRATAASSAWDAALRGRHLVYLYTGNGYSERLDLVLGQQGAFSTSSDASSLSANGSGAVQGGGQGTWTITAAGQLLLNYHDGRQASYTLAPGQAGNEVSLNGRRYFLMGE